MKKFLTALFVIFLLNASICVAAEDAVKYFNRGNTYLSQKQYERAIQEYTKAIQLKPNYALAYNNRGSCYNELGQDEWAISDYNKAIQSEFALDV